MKEYRLKIDGKEYNVAVNEVSAASADVTVNGVRYNVEIDGDVPAAAPASAAAPAQAPKISASAPAPAAAPASKGGSAEITSPLPGVIIEVCVSEGDVVKRGQKVAVLEAMKMENDILATQDGTVSAVKVSKGDSVLEGAVIIALA